MSKVVYLLGAGASFGTRENGIGSPILTGLPIVRVQSKGPLIGEPYRNGFKYKLTFL